MYGIFSISTFRFTIFGLLLVYFHVCIKNRATLERIYMLLLHFPFRLRAGNLGCSECHFDHAANFRENKKTLEMIVVQTPTMSCYQSFKSLHFTVLFTFFEQHCGIFWIYQNTFRHLWMTAYAALNPINHWFLEAPKRIEASHSIPYSFNAESSLYAWDFPKPYSHITFAFVPC